MRNPNTDPAPRTQARSDSSVTSAVAHGRGITRRHMLALAATGIATVLLGGCAAEETPGSTPAPAPSPSPEPTPTPTPETSQTATGSVLVAYFSMPETTVVENMTEEEDNSTVVINGTVLGNVQYLAQLIGEQTGGTVMRLETATPYTTNHEDLIAQAQQEKNESFRPELLASSVPTPNDIAAADTIFLGYPNWWGDLPMALYTLLETVDFSGTTIIPFNCHGGSGFSSTRETIARLQPEADVRIDDGFTVSRSVVENSADDVSAWLTELGFAE